MRYQAIRQILFLFISLLLLNIPYAIAQDCLDYPDYYPDLAPTGPRIHAAGLGQAVAVSGSVLAFATDTGLQLHDISDPLNPVWLASVPVWADRLVVHGDFLYTARYGFGVQAVDISDPTAPVITESARNEYGTFDLLVHDNHLFVTPNLDNFEWWFGITVYDVTDPAHPTYINEVEGFAGFSIEMYGDTLLLANYDPAYANMSFLGSADLSDPANPAYLEGWLSFPGRVQDIAIYDHYLYAPTDTHGLYVIDIAIPTSPVIVHEMPELAGSNHVLIVGETAWVSILDGGGDNLLVSLSLADPALPQLQEGTAYEGDDLYLAAADDWLYMACAELEPVLVNISDPMHPSTHAWTGTTPGEDKFTVEGLAVVGDLVYVGSKFGDPLRIIDVSDPLTPQEIAGIPGDLLGGDVAVCDTLLFQMVKDPDQPMNRWFDTYSITDPLNPVHLGRGEVGSFTLNLAATKEAVYSTLNGMIHVMDVTDPANPFHTQTLNPPGNGNGRDLLVKDNHLYAPLTSSGLVIYNIADALDPHLEAVVPLPYCFAVDIEGDLAYATDYYKGLSVIDISDPARPEILSQQPTLQSGRCIEVDGSKLFITTSYTEGWVYDLTDPLDPQLEGEFFIVSGALELDVVGPWLAMGQAGRGLQFAWRACQEVTPVSDERLPTVAGIMAAPNPFNPRTTITYTLMRSGEVEVSIHDLAGRRVAQLVSGWRGEGTNSVVWNGCDDGGRALPSGSYLVRSRWGGGVQTSKLTLVR